MPIKSNIKSSKFAPQIRGFDTVNGTNTLRGAISEQIRVVYEIELFWYAEIGDFEIFDGGERIVRKDGGNFLSDGFVVGDRLHIKYGFWNTSPFQDFEGNCLAISEDGGTIFTNFQGFVNGPVSADKKCILAGITNLTNCEYAYGLIENNEPFSIRSKVDGSDQRYYVKNIQSAPVTVNGEIAGTVRGWANSMDTIKITKLPNSQLPIFREPNFGVEGGTVQEAVQNFELTHEFTLLPFYTVSQFDNLKNGVAPDFLSGSNSLKHVFECQFRKNITDSNSITARFENLKGNVGFYGENFNGFTTQYSVEDIKYYTQPSNLENESLLVGITKVVARIKSANGTFSGGQNVIVAHSYLPGSESEYENSTKFFNQNFAFETNKVGTIIYDYSQNLIDANTLELEFLVDTQNVLAKLTSESNYLLSIILDNPSLSQENSDRTALILDINTYDLDPDIPGLFEVTNCEIYDHATDFIEQGYTDFKGWIQDGYAIKGMFRLNRLKEALLKTISVDLVAWKDGTNKYFTLQSNQFNITNSVIDQNGNQQIFIDTVQGFKLSDADQFNKKVLVTGNFDGEWIEYGFSCGLKINWQEWLALAGVDTVFYDVLEPNFGLNQNASRYSLKNGYSLKTIINATVLQGNIDTNYIHKTDLIANNFGELGDLDWELTQFKTFDVNNVNLNGAILVGEDTIIKAEFISNIVALPILEEYYGILRLDRYLSNSDKQIYELSSIRPFPTNNLLKPVDGESLLKMYIDGSKIVIEGRTDGALIEKGQRFTISGRLGKLEGTQPVLGDFNLDFNDDFFV
jgi:hypothetical protein